jgi:transposase
MYRLFIRASRSQISKALLTPVGPVKATTAKLNAEEVLVYLPPYSPDLNPIELAWSKIKHYLRKARARTVDELYQAISQALTMITSENAAGFFEHVGVCIH